MLFKPLNIILIYLVCCCNLLYISAPFLAFLIPFVEFNRGVFTISTSYVAGVGHFYMLTVFLIFFLMLAYCLLDYLLGFSVRSSLNGCKRYEKYKEYDFLTPIITQVREKFNQNSVKLYIKNTDEICAFAVGSFGAKSIVISRGMIEHYLVLCTEPKMFLSVVRSVLSHEMSHLINKDFLPSFIIMTNQKITNFFSAFLHLIFIYLARVIDMIPRTGRSSANAMIFTYNLINNFLMFFNSYIVFNLYNFLHKFLSRSVEYRCDNQASKAFGGHNMALALSMLGHKGFFTIFSSHPSTKSRIKKIENIKMKESVIGPTFFDAFINYLTLLMMMMLTMIFAKLAKIDLIIRQILQNHQEIYRKLSYLWQLINKFI